MMSGLGHAAQVALGNVEQRQDAGFRKAASAG